MPTRDPIWAVMREQGRSLAWLARRTSYSLVYVRQMACGMTPVTAEFRRRACVALSLPEVALFLPVVVGNLPVIAATDDELEPVELGIRGRA